MKKVIYSTRRITAADEDEFIDDEAVEEPGFNLEDEEDSDIEDIREDDPTIEIDNNIAGHYIAECERCHGIFISSVTESDQEIESISGICPLCDHETTQWLNWVVVDVKERRKMK